MLYGKTQTFRSYKNVSDLEELLAVRVRGIVQWDLLEPETGLLVCCATRISNSTNTAALGEHNAYVRLG